MSILAGPLNILISGGCRSSKQIIGVHPALENSCRSCLFRLLSRPRCQISRWIADALEDCPTEFLHLAADVKALQETIALSSGLGIMEIWSSLMTERPLRPFTDDLICLGCLARNLKDDIYGALLSRFSHL